MYPYLKSRVSNLKAYRFSLIWTILAVILLSVVPEKKARYLMPVLIPLAINTGFYLEYLIRNFKNLKDKRETFPVYFNFGLIAFIGILFPFSAIFIGHLLQGVYLFWFILASLLQITLAILILTNLRRKLFDRVIYLCIVFMASLLITVLPLSDIQKKTNYTPISNLKEVVDEQDLKVFSMNYIAPEIIWQYGDKIISIKNEAGIINLPEESKFGLLSNEIDQNDLKTLENKFIIEKKETYDLNIPDENSKKYNVRLKSDFYILTKR